MYYLDTYALYENGLKQSPAFDDIFNSSYMLCELILCEFYGIILRELGRDQAQKWLSKLLPLAEPTPFNVLLEAIEFRQTKKKLNLSYFDCVGYLHAISNNGIFVTGDKAFEHLPNVKYIK